VNPNIVWRSGVVLFSVVVWTALWSDVSAANVLWGAVIGLVSLVVLPLPDGGDNIRFRPVAIGAYFLYAAWALVKSSAVVAWEVVTPRSRINQAIVEVPLRTRSRGVTTLVANTVSLTPGTLTLEIRRDPPALYVHILHLRTIDEVRAEVGKLEDLALRAFPVADALPAAEVATGAAPTEEST
jgi:multicomponent Na+:H+ antiporter subunit E